MIRFDCDYTEGAHERILNALVATNSEQHCGYGLDDHCENARALIKKACGREDADVHFLVGGTQANFTVIASVLRPYQGVLSADSGHINGHETGAVEATGHKVLALPSVNGKISAAQIEKAYNEHWADGAHEHIVQPGMVYISQSTEWGTVYSKQELEELYSVCKKLSLPLFIDGARLGYALASGAAPSLEEMAQLCDVFYIGGTKVGLLFGEAVVITNEALKKDFRYMIKQRGGMLAKGRLLGVQFEEMFRDGLYLEIAKHAVDIAMEIKTALQEKGIEFYIDSPTNQQFPILTKSQSVKLGEKFALCYTAPVDDDHDVWRICTSFMTTRENADCLISEIAQI